MGLDTYAAARDPTDEDWEDFEARYGLTDDDIAAFERAEAELTDADGSCLFSGNYFRGKLYDDLVRRVAGVGLYQVWIPPETVRFMADAFADCDPEAVIRAHEASDDVYEHTTETISELRRFFEVCAERDLGLVGSW